MSNSANSGSVQQSGLQSKNSTSKTPPNKNRGFNARKAMFRKRRLDKEAVVEGFEPVVEEAEVELVAEVHAVGPQDSVVVVDELVPTIVLSIRIDHDLSVEVRVEEEG
ncbi:hypothetical protein BLOT_005988 [Blomia tropicalis]|nr:hypothetical protein BLOT_005988 [Blomia tropicalis]